LALWLDAKQITGVATGTPLLWWPDFSGNHRHPTQVTAGSRPTYQSAAINGQPGVRFDGVDDYLTLSGNVVTGAQARTVFVVGRPTVVGNKGFIDLGHGGTVGGAFMLTSEYAVRVSGGNAIFGPAATAGTPALYVVQLNGTTTATINAWQNGAPRNVTSSTNVTIATTGPGIVGGWAAVPVAATSYAGDIAEIVVYDRALSLTERQNLEQYLTAKYGLPWSAGSTPTATRTGTRTPTPSATATSTPAATHTPTAINRFVDNGDGTISDTFTGLQWEQKDDNGGVHDKDEGYNLVPAGTWDARAYTVFLATLNSPTAPGGCLGGHCDWRLPTRPELETILLAPYPCPVDPCIDPIFEPISTLPYWAPATDSLAYAEYVLFRDGATGMFVATAPFAVRAVRWMDQY
jgi:hypothetical protein